MDGSARCEFSNSIDKIFDYPVDDSGETGVNVVFPLPDLTADNLHLAETICSGEINWLCFARTVLPSTTPLVLPGDPVLSPACSPSAGWKMQRHPVFRNNAHPYAPDIVALCFIAPARDS